MSESPIAVQLSTLKSKLKEEKKYKRKYAHHLKLNMYDTATLTDLYSQCLGSVIHLSSNMANMIQHDVTVNNDHHIALPLSTEEDEAKNPSSSLESLDTLNLFEKVHEFGDVLSAENELNVAEIQRNFNEQYSALVDHTKKVIVQIKGEFDQRLRKRTESLMSSQRESMQNMDAFWKKTVDEAVAERNEHHQGMMRQIMDKLVAIKTSCAKELETLKQQNEGLRSEQLEEKAKYVLVIDAMKTAEKWNLQRIDALRGEVETLRKSEDCKSNEIEQLLDGVVTVEEQNTALNVELETKRGELEASKEKICRYEGMLRDVRAQLQQIRDQHIREGVAHDAQVMVALQEKVMAVAADIEIAQSIKHRAAVNEMEMKLNVAAQELRCTQSQAQQQQSKNEEVISRLRGNVEIYKQRNHDMKIRVKFLERSMADLGRVYPRSRRQTRPSLQSTVARSIDDHELLKEVRKLREELRSKNMELAEQRAGHNMLRQKLELTEQVYGGYKKELDSFIQKTNQFVRQQLM